jgi:hypothetical protein
VSEFLSELIVTPHPSTAKCDGVNWKLVQDLAYRSDVLKLTVIVPAGFLTDFASTPQALWCDLPPTGKYTPAAVLHDYAYFEQFCTREQADAMLFEAMGELGVDSRRRWLIYEGVRAGGQHAWTQDAIDRAAGKQHAST